MATWTPCPACCQKRLEGDRLQDLWTPLHRNDLEPWPADPALREGWRRFHEGDFEAAASAGRAAGGDRGAALEHRATCSYATYVEPHEPARFALLQEVAERAQRQQTLSPGDASAWYWQGHALGRYSQGISVARALARGLGRQVRTALETCLRLAPDHVDAHLALARFHAETIDQVGELIGGMVHGARKDLGLEHYGQALRLSPDSLTVLHEAADGLWMLSGEAAQGQVAELLEHAATLEPRDATECLYLRAARAVADA